MKNTSTLNASDCPLVTVITATYNLIDAGRKDYIAQCIQSVYEQTYPNIEHIIVDGRSSDGTLDLLSKYEQNRWVTIYSEPDEGIYDAFNKGLRLAKGKYIAFLNSDDLWHNPRGVETSVRMLEEHQADFSYAPCLVERKFRGGWKTDSPISRFFAFTPFCHQTMLGKTALLREMGGFDTKYKICADCNLIVRLILSGTKPVRIPICFTTFRDGGFSDTRVGGSGLLQEQREMYRSIYASFVSEDNLDKILKYELPPSFLDMLMQKVHPIIATELKTRCQWIDKEQIWQYQGIRNSFGPFGPRCINSLIYVLNLFIPRWYQRFLELYNRIL